MGASGRGGTSCLFNEPNVGGLPRRHLLGSWLIREPYRLLCPYRYAPTATASTRLSHPEGDYMTPNWRIMVIESYPSQPATSLPSEIRTISIPGSVTRLPVGARPASSPSWVPVPFQRVVTLSPSAI